MERDLAKPVGTSLDRFIKLRQDEFSGVSGEFSQMLRDIGLAARIINRELNHFGLLNISGTLGTENIQGEEQKKMDLIANTRFIRALEEGGEICAIVSEEEDDIIEIDKNKKYIIALDPLDGSSNIDVTVAVGTIFSIFRRKSATGTKVTKDDILQKGSEQLAAGYVIYGSSAMLVYTTGKGVNGFTFSPSIGEFFLSHPDMTIPNNGIIYSINESLTHEFEQPVLDYLEHCKNNNYTLRYTGSLVTDFHRNLLKGGIYMYPKCDKTPNGKLRLLYECNALALLCEQAGGQAFDGQKRILNLQPTDFHQRTPFYVGSEEMVEKVISLLN
jgi:fructose-1,6-bisphosphatase I